jgi:pilus assembly protein CpaB
MRNKKLFIVLFSATICGLIAAVSVSRYLANAQSNKYSKIVVANTNIPIGTKIELRQLALVQSLADATPDATFSDPSKLVGRVAITNIAVREPITDYKLAAEGTAGGLSAVIPEGYRAMTVKVDDVIGLSGYVLPGTLVDVVVVIAPNDTHKDPISKIVLQNIKVLASGQNIERKKDDHEPEKVKAVTLQVTPEQAEKLALAATEGTLQLVMRNSGDQENTETPGINKQTLLVGDNAKPVVDAGALKSEQPQAAMSKPRRAVRIARVSAPRSRSRASQAVEIRPDQPVSREAVEIISGGKKQFVQP